jgi:hypothetical protein
MIKNPQQSLEVLKKNNITIAGNLASEKTIIFVHGLLLIKLRGAK